uniref:Uncharacterized protein n=1 Tax=Nelumbo nucifera TaxID=4432 RepID=A0A822Y3G9_NELNU|nr:TPA_asm: hypothetical protein HUJ06_029932 [Nelumbo nucifera]
MQQYNKICKLCCASKKRKARKMGKKKVLSLKESHNLDKTTKTAYMRPSDPLTSILALKSMNMQNVSKDTIAFSGISPRIFHISQCPCLGIF